MALIFSKVLSIFLIVGVGFAANKRGILPEASNQFLVNLLMSITSPCMILTSIAGKELTEGTLSISLLTFAGAALYFLLFSLAAYLLFYKVFHFQPISDIPVYMLIFVSMNCGFMGFPLTLSLFGDEILYLMVIINIVLNFYLFPFASIQLRLFDHREGSSAGCAGGGSGRSRRMHKGRILFLGIKGAVISAVNPCTLAAVAGLILLFTGFPIPSFLFSSLEMIGDATVPLSMLLVGVKLGGSNFRRLFQNRKLLLAAGLRLCIVPALMFCIVNPLPLAVNLKIALIFAACFPSAVAIVPVTSMEHKNSLLASEGVALTTLLSLITIPVYSMLLISYYGLA